jgi:hypothetical protein
MKKIIKLFILIVCFALTVNAQSNNLNKSVASGDYFSRDTLTASVDTADIATGQAGVNYSRWVIQIYTTTGTDTINVYTKSNDGKYWIQRSLQDQIDNSITSNIIASTTAKEYTVLDSKISTIRLVSASDDASTTVFIVSAESGAEISGINSIDNIKSDTVSMSLPTGGAALPLHAIGDVVGQSLTAASCPLLKLPNAARNTNGSGAGSGGYITHIYVEADSIPAGIILATIIKDSTGMTYMADNAAYAPTYNMGKNVVDAVPLSFTAQGTNGTGKIIASASCLIPYTCIAGSQALYLRISCITAVTFKYGGSLFIRITYDRN